MDKKLKKMIFCLGLLGPTITSFGQSAPPVLQQTPTGVSWLEVTHPVYHLGNHHAWMNTTSNMYDVDNLWVDSVTQTSYYGVIYNKNSWSNLNDFSVNTASATVSGGKIVMSGGTGAFTQYLALGGASMLFHWKAAVKYHMTASGFGLGIGMHSINTYGSNSILWRCEGPGTGGSAPLQYMDYTNGDSTSYIQQIQASARNFNLATNDEVLLTIERNGAKMLYTARNMTTNSVETDTSYVFGYSGATLNAPNTGLFSLWNLGGSISIDSLAVTSNEVVGANVMFIGDSKTAGFLAGNLDSSYTYLLGKNYWPTVVHAGGYDRTVEVVAALKEIKALRPKQVFLAIGSNDPRSGLTTAQFDTNYVHIADSLVSWGIKVYYSTPFYETSQDLSGQLSFITSNYSPVINCWSPMYIPGSLGSDGVHPSPIGHQRIAGAIRSSYLIGGANTNTLDYVPKKTLQDLVNDNNTIVTNQNIYGLVIKSSTSKIGDIANLGFSDSAGNFAGLGLASGSFFSSSYPAIRPHSFVLSNSVSSPIADVSLITVGGSILFQTQNSIQDSIDNAGTFHALAGISNSGSSPDYIWNYTGGGTDAKNWDAWAQSNNLYFRTINDANILSNVWMQVTRSGYTPTKVTFPESVSITNLTLTSLSAGALGDSILTDSAGITRKIPVTTLIPSAGRLDTTIILSSNYTNSTSTASAIASFSAVSGKTYTIDCKFSISASSNNGAGIGWTGSSITGTTVAYGTNTSSSNFTSSTQTSSSGPSAVFMGASGSGFIELFGTITASANTTVNIVGLSQTGSTLTVNSAGTFMRIRQVN